MRPDVIPLVVLSLASFCLSACSLDAAARDRFSQDMACPLDRTQSRPRDELPPFAVLFEIRSPPADVKADPARLALWQAKESRTMDTWNSSCHVFEVRGCGQEALYCCSHSKIPCSSAHYPPGAAKWPLTP